MLKLGTYYLEMKDIRWVNIRADGSVYVCYTNGGAVDFSASEVTPQQADELRLFCEVTYRDLVTFLKQQAVIAGLAEKVAVALAEDGDAGEGPVEVTT